MKLGKRELEIYEYILDYTQKNMYAPTIREIGKAAGLKSTSAVSYYLMHLESKGLIEVGQNSPRAIRLVGYSIVPNCMIEELNRLRAEKETSE